MPHVLKSEVWGCNPECGRLQLGGSALFLYLISQSLFCWHEEITVPSTTLSEIQKV